MSKRMLAVLGGFLVVAILSMITIGCMPRNTETKDREQVSKQQDIYQRVQPVHIYDYSIPRDIYQQIYDITVTKAVATYTVVETMTGVTKFRGPSVGFPIPADVQLTNPLQSLQELAQDPVVEQAEPNGMFSSKNTDGTWILFVDLKSGEVYPIYTEHKATTFPFIVEKNSDGEWVRADNKPIGFKVEIRKGPSGSQPIKPPIIK